MPEVLTETEPQQGQASNADLCRAAQAHYDKVSTAAHEWHSVIPKAIDAYFVDPERSRLERLVIEAATKWRRAQGEYLHPAEVDAGVLAVVRAWFGLRKATDALIDFESKQQQIKK